jgi:hypothetical protein
MVHFLPLHKNPSTKTNQEQVGTRNIGYVDVITVDKNQK